jgi:anthranilate synthase component 2
MGEIMAVKHRDYEIYGLQFHPESILTVDGKKLLENFLDIK